MARASITTPDGIAIDVEGSPEEVARVVEDLRRQNAPAPKTNKGTTSGSARGRLQIPDLVGTLKSDEFFKSPRGLGEVQKKLAEMGFHYPITTLSGAMQKQARNRALRRFKQDGKYVYVQDPSTTRKE